MKRSSRFFGMRKMDEMEKYIEWKAQRNAYRFLMAALLLWTFYEGFRAVLCQSMLNILPCALLVISVLIRIFSRLVLARNAVKDDDDSDETLPLMRIILFICFVVGIFVTIVMTIMTMVVRI